MSQQQQLKLSVPRPACAPGIHWEGQGGDARVPHAMRATLGLAPRHTREHTGPAPVPSASGDPRLCHLELGRTQGLGLHQTH